MSGKLKIGILLLLSCLAGESILAGPYLKILRVDGLYPHLVIEAQLLLPSDISDSGHSFTVSELPAAVSGALRSGETVVNPASSSDEIKPLLMVVVLDATRSMRPSSFIKAQSLASDFINARAPYDLTAVFKINGRPELLYDFNSDKTGAVAAVRSIQRKGQVTRIYDSLFAAIRSARDAISRDREITRASVIMFTDGRDEGSHLTETDCIDLSEQCRALNIPVHTIYFGQARNERRWTRLSLRTGGRLVHASDRTSLQNLRDSLRGDISRTIRFDFTGSVKAAAGEKLNIALQWKSGRLHDNDSSVYEVKLPPEVAQPGFFTKERILLLVIGLFVFFVAGALLLLWYFHVYKKRTEAAKVAAGPLPSADVPGSGGSMDLVAGEESAVPYDPYDEEPFPARLEEPRRYLKENSYKLLQHALRTGESYDHATLVRKGRVREGINNDYDLFFDTTVLGSGRYAHIHLNDPNANAVHAKVKRYEKKYILYDMMSHTGVFLNNRKLLRPRALADGDEIKAGHSLFIFRGIREDKTP